MDNIFLALELPVYVLKAVKIVTKNAEKIICRKMYIRIIISSNGTRLRRKELCILPSTPTMRDRQSV